MSAISGVEEMIVGLSPTEAAAAVRAEREACAAQRNAATDKVEELTAQLAELRSVEPFDPDEEGTILSALATLQATRANANEAALELTALLMTIEGEPPPSPSPQASWTIAPTEPTA